MGFIKATVFLLLVAVGLIAVLNVLEVAYEVDEGWMCAQTGSVKSRTTRFWLFKSRPSYETSPIEKAMRERDMEFDHEWVKVRGKRKYFLGGVERAHSRVPSIYTLNHQSQGEIIQSLNSENLAKTLRTLQSESVDDAFVTLLLRAFLDGDDLNVAVQAYMPKAQPDVVN